MLFEFGGCDTTFVECFTHYHSRNADFVQGIYVSHTANTTAGYQAYAAYLSQYFGI